MSTKNEYPLFPELSEEAQKEAQVLLDSFKEKMKVVSEEVISSFYCDVANYIESDSWSNFRRELMDGLMNYGNKKIQGEYDFKRIRQSILKNHREEIVNDLNQDLLSEIDELKNAISFLQEERSNRF
jgi:hypothetical protein